jgi:hypothetical protein
MEGPSHEDPEQCGIIPRMIFSIFDGIARGDAEVYSLSVSLAAPVFTLAVALVRNIHALQVEYQVMVSYIEIYMERVRDLLNPVNENLNVREDKRRGVYIQV